MPELRIVVLAGPGTPTHILVHHLRRHFPLAGVIMEQPPSKWTLLRRRSQRIGWMRTAGQVLFLLLVAPLLKRTSTRRRAGIMHEKNLNDTALPEGMMTQVASVNSEEAIAAVRSLRPDVVVVSGTRIIGHRLLSGITAPFINIHAGITPRYRGIHGVYWALMNNDAANAGVTVHMVDSGIDTGRIIAQAHVPHAREDNFATYPLLQLAAGLDLLVTALRALADGKLSTVSREMDSKLWYHPTLLQYLMGRWRKGIK